MADTKDIDHGCWEQFTAGDKSAYTVLYRFYYPRLYNYGIRLCQDAAWTEDCIQELMTQIWFKRGMLGRVERPTSYLFVAFRHRILKTHATLPLLTGLAGGDQSFPLELAPDELLMDQEQETGRHVYLQKALDTLTPRQREAVFLKFYEEMSYEEISSMLDISTKAAYKLIARAIGELRVFSVRHPVLDVLLSLGWFLLMAQSLLIG